MAVARVGCVLSPVRTFRDQLYRDRLRRGVGLVPDDVDDPGNLHEAVVRGARREDVRGAGRVVAPVDGHAALRDIDEARPGVHMPPTAGSEPATGGDAGVPRNPLDEEVGISFGLHDRVPELWVLGLDVQGDSAERGLRERLAAEARGGSCRRRTDGSADGSRVRRNGGDSENKSPDPSFAHRPTCF